MGGETAALKTTLPKCPCSRVSQQDLICMYWLHCLTRLRPHTQKPWYTLYWSGSECFWEHKGMQWMRVKKGVEEGSNWILSAAWCPSNSGYIIADVLSLSLAEFLSASFFKPLHLGTKAANNRIQWHASCPRSCIGWPWDARCYMYSALLLLQYPRWPQGDTQAHWTTRVQPLRGHDVPRSGSLRG